MSVTGQNTHSELPESESTVSIVFDQKPDGTPCGVLYVNDGVEQTEVYLSRDELRVLAQHCYAAMNYIDWENAWWIYAKGPLSSDKYHLMRKGKHDEKGKPLCGKSVSSYYPHTWELSPVINEPRRTDSMCKLCLAAYDRTVFAGDK
jgi:hypothetical protein